MDGFVRVKIVVYTGVTEEGTFKPGDTPNLREGTADEWIKRGWAIHRPDLEEKKPPERAVIETPEDHAESAERETAMLRRRSRKKLPE